MEATKGTEKRIEEIQKQRSRELDQILTKGREGRDSYLPHSEPRPEQERFLTDADLKTLAK